MELNDTAKLPDSDARKINAVASQAYPLGLLPNLKINFYSIDAIQLELRDNSGDLIWRDFTFSRDFIKGFMPYIRTRN
mgnify:FL=1